MFIQSCRYINFHSLVLFAITDDFNMVWTCSGAWNKSDTKWRKYFATVTQVTELCINKFRMLLSERVWTVQIHFCTAVSIQCILVWTRFYTATFSLPGHPHNSSAIRMYWHFCYWHISLIRWKNVYKKEKKKNLFILKQMFRVTK